MDSQTMKITMFLGIALMLALVIFLSMGVMKDVAAAAGGKIGMQSPGDDDRTFVTNPTDVLSELSCKRSEENLKDGQFTYEIKIDDIKIQTDYKGDVRPVLYFKSNLKKSDMVPKEKVVSGTLPALSFSVKTVIAPTYTTEDFTLFLLKKTPQCEAALSLPTLNEDVFVSQCKNAGLERFMSSARSCPRLPSVKLERVETKTEKGVKKCSPVFKVINNDNLDWVKADGYSALIKNCFPEKNPPDNDLWRPKMEDVARLYRETIFIRSYEIPKGMSIIQDADAYCPAQSADLTIELYKGCRNIKTTSASCYCVNKYQGVDNYRNGECKNWRDDPFNKNLNPPNLVDSISFACQP